MEKTAAFDRAVALLPERLRGEALFLESGQRLLAEELRLYCGKGLRVVLPDGMISLKQRISREDVEQVLERASRSSYHTVQESMKTGFLTAPGGYRIGICGSVVRKSGETAGFRQISSLCIRIPRQAFCVPPELAAELADKSVLILSPPGGGKTTFLRELVRQTSNGGRRVSLVDERGELAAMEGGVPHFDIGENTDVLEFCPKAQAVEMLLRAMSPQVIAMDELGATDGEALCRAADSGVQIFASVHCASQQELRRKAFPDRPLIR